MGKTLLLIEDNLEMRENTAEILELASYQVKTAENGKIGIKKAKKEKPDLIICDIMMPEIDGYEVLYMLSRDPATAGIPFIFLTAKVEKGDMRKGMDLGADDYLTKPFEEMELLNAVESRLRRNEVFKAGFTKDISGIGAFLDEARGIGALHKLSEDRKLRRYKEKETIYFEGGYPGGMYFLNKGKVKTYRMNDNGKELITGIFNAGEFIGYMALLKDCDYTETCEAIEECELFKIPRNDFLLLLDKNMDVANRFIKMLADDLVEKEEQLLSFAYNSVKKRVCEALILLKDKNASGNKDDSKISVPRDDLANLVGTATETVIRTLSEFKEDKLIKIKGRLITIIDHKGLEKYKY